MMRFCFLIVCVILFSCTADKGTLLISEVESGCDSTISVTYTNKVKSIATTNCTFSGCHDAGSGNGDFTTYSGVKIKVDNGTFNQRVLVLKDMPPSHSPGPKFLSQCDLALLRKWVNDGAPEN